MRQEAQGLSKKKMMMRREKRRRKRRAEGEMASIHRSALYCNFLTSYCQQRSASSVERWLA